MYNWIRRRLARDWLVVLYTPYGRSLGLMGRYHTQRRAIRRAAQFGGYAQAVPRVGH